MVIINFIMHLRSSWNNVNVEDEDLVGFFDDFIPCCCGRPTCLVNGVVMGNKIKGDAAVGSVTMAANHEMDGNTRSIEDVQSAFEQGSESSGQSNSSASSSSSDVADQISEI